MDQNVLAKKFSTTGKKVLVTGGGRGIGKGIAMAFAQTGADIIILDINEENIQATAQEISEKTGVTVYSKTANLLQKEQIPVYIDEIIKECGGVDVLVNNAGIQYRIPALDFPLDKWERLFSLHVTATFLLSQAVVPFMKEQGGGAIINLASLCSIVPFQNIIAYNAAKHAVAGLTKSMALEWGKYNIRTNAIGPGHILTDQTKEKFKDKDLLDKILNDIPLGRLGEPRDDLGFAAVFLATEAAQYINGQILYIDGGWLVT